MNELLEGSRGIPKKYLLASIVEDLLEEFLDWLLQELLEKS